MTIDLEERFKELSTKVPIVDTHNDFPYSLRVQLHNEIYNEPNFDFDKILTSHTDLVRMRQDFNAANSAVRDTLEQIDVTKRLVDEYSKHLKFVRTADEAMSCFKNEDGKIAVTLGVEGLHQCDLSLAVVRLYHELGVRYITLTHNCDNPFATAASTIAAGKPDEGLTKYGQDCIKEMNRLGMIVDLSHVSYRTMLDTLEHTKAPVMFSHSSSYKLTPHERNVRDDVLLKVKSNGGVVCVNFLPLFLTQNESKTATIQDAVDHIKHIVDLIGWDHVGLGSDFDGIPSGPKGLEDVSKYPDLIKKVWEVTNAKEEDIAKLMGLNVVRVWKECELVSQSLKDHKPVESNWEDRRWVFEEYCKEFPELFPGGYELKGNIYVSEQQLVYQNEE